jgi:flagellar hook-length control protein FliK
MIEAVPIPAATLAMSPNQGTVVLQAAGVAGVVPGVAINSAAAGVLFGMMMTQLAAGMSQPALGQETDARAPKSEAPQQPSPDATSVLASLVPLLMSLQIAPQPVSPVAPESPQALPTGPVSAVDPTLTPLALATLAATEIGPSEHPALSAGKHLEAALLQSSLPVTVPQEVTTQVPGMPVIPTHEQGSGIHTTLTTILTAGEKLKPSEAATTGVAGPVLGQAFSPPLTSSDKKLDQLQAPVKSPILIDATLTMKQDEGRDNVLNLLAERNTRVTDSMPLGTEKIPAEFLAGPAALPSASKDSVVPLSKAAIVGDVLPTALASPRETIHLQFGPSELGRLTLQVSVQSQQVQATVSVEHRGLGELLAASQGTLDGALRQHGLRLEELHIDTMGNADVLGAGAGRTGLLDHGQPRQDSPGFDREPFTSPAPEREVSITRADILEPLGPRHRINLFA